jgi:hypothetical protein
MTRDQFIAKEMGVPTFIPLRDAYELIQYVMATDWWGDFYCGFAYNAYKDKNKYWSEELVAKWLFSDPDRFASLVAEYKGWKEGKG